MMLYSVKELQNILNIGRDTCYSLVKSKAFPSIKIGKRYFVSQESLAKWLATYEHKEFKI